MSTLSFAQQIQQTSSFDAFGPPPPEGGLKKLMRKFLKSASKVFAAVAILFTINSAPVYAKHSVNSVSIERSDVYNDWNSHNQIAAGIRSADVRNWLNPGPLSQMRGHLSVDSAITANIIRLGGSLDRSEIKSNVFFRILQCKDRLLALGDDEMIRFIHKIIANTIIDLRRRKKTADKMGDALKAYSDSVGESTVSTYEEFENSQLVKKFVVKLTRREHEVFVLSAKGHTIKEIVELLSIKPATVKSHRSNYARKFKNMIEPVES